MIKQFVLEDYNKRMKMIQVPDGLISNQYRKDGIKVSPKTTYLYAWLKILLTDYEEGIVEIKPINLRNRLQWKTNNMLKNHLKILKDLGDITYQDEFDNGQFKPNQLLIIKITKIKSNFKQLTERSIKEKILPSTNEPEKALRLCYLFKGYTNKNYGYCWLTYEQIEKWGRVRQKEINNINNQLVKAELLHINKGKTIKDNQGRIRKENNKYQLLLN